ncbi:trypsin-like peptidase domain-containing protein, partial [Myxococcota bacterium]|nr:trypsin-like peptidase domain-containing protein [Myxococcota bacterium]
GSGVIISELGLVLTNAHVVDDKKVVQVVLHDGRKFSAPVVERAANDVDLALVQLPVTAVPYLKLENNVDLRVGQWVASVGHGSGGIWTFNTGMVSNIYPDGAEKPVFQTQIPLNPGSSGGPIFNRHGQVVGIVTAGIMESNSINFGIKIDMAMRNLTKLGHLCDCLVITAPKGVPIFVDGKMVGKGGEKLTVPVSRGMHEVFAVIGGKMNKQKVDFPKRRFVNLK